MRASGILMHITSLPSKYGIGTMGEEAYKFVDFLAAAKQTYWQILPVGPTSYGDSPYQSFSTHAGNPYFIDFDMLAEDGLLEKSEYSRIKWGADKTSVDYETIYNKRFNVLRKAFSRFDTSDAEFTRFLDENERWVSNYALFMTAKDAYGGAPWLMWDDGLKRRDPHSLWEFKTAHSDDVLFWEFLQYKFMEQWKKLKAYANENGVRIIGDIPIYVALDSAPVWVYPDLFELQHDLTPRRVAGCPPDVFSPTGQLWGNPLYDWRRHKETGYNWWIDRLTAACEMYDVVRIDHFRGFDSYYAIPYGDKTAENGEWLGGPGIEFFRFLESRMGKLPLIAEDLGFLTPSVIKMLEDSGFPGMKVLEFAFDPDSESDYLPYMYGKNSVAYIGTHDNPTVLGWAAETDKRTVDFCKKYIMAQDMPDSEFVWRFIETAHACVSDTVVIQIQDYLALGASARMNVPSTTGGNWRWRAEKGVFTKELAEKIADITRTYGRAPR